MNKEDLLDLRSKKSKALATGLKLIKTNLEFIESLNL